MTGRPLVLSATLKDSHDHIYTPPAHFIVVFHEKKRAVIPTADLLDPSEPQTVLIVPERPAIEIEALLAAPEFPHAVFFLARNFIETHHSAPKECGAFAAQQRWLLSHAALGAYFASLDGPEPGVTRRQMGNIALQHGLSSRNTANAFFDEARKYGVLQPLEPPSPGRPDAMQPSPKALALLSIWIEAHVHALDMLDRGNRAAQFRAAPEASVRLIEPRIARALLESAEVRMPTPLYTIFTWADSGGHLMDRLIAGIDPDAEEHEHGFVTDIVSISSLAQAYDLSRAHTSRKIAAAEEIGGLGWTGRRGHSRLWVSRGFFAEYARAQALKLAIIDAAIRQAAPVFLRDAAPQGVSAYAPLPAERPSP